MLLVKATLVIFKAAVMYGDGLSTALFNLILESAMRYINQGFILTERVEVCSYANDVAHFKREKTKWKMLLSYNPRKVVEDIVNVWK